MTHAHELPLHESDPRSEFQQVLDAISERFEAALDAQYAMPDYQHVTTSPGHYPEGIDHPLLFFALAEHYERARLGKAEMFEIGVPVDTLDTLYPDVLLDGSEDQQRFLLTYWQKRVEKRLIVTPENYADTFNNPAVEPPVRDFLSKLWLFQIIPVTKPLGPIRDEPEY